MRKVILMDRFQNLLYEVPTIEDTAAQHKTDAEMFFQLTELLYDNDYVNQDLLAVPTSQWDWYTEKLFGYHKGDEFWNYIQNGKVERKVHIQAVQAFLALPPAKEGLLYV